MKFMKLSAPVTVQWEVTPWCNNRCIHCYNYWRANPQDQQKIIVSEAYLDVLSAATEQIIANHVFQCTITGGEPLAVLEHIFPLIGKLVQNGVQIALNTNVTLLTRTKARLLKEIDKIGILTSLMSNDPGLHDELAQREGTFQRTMRGIAIAKEAGLRVSVNMVVTKRNLNDIYQTAQFLNGVGIKSFAATKASKPSSCDDFSSLALTKEEFQFMLQTLARVRSELGINVDSLEHYPACSFPDSATRTFFGSRICNAGKTACTIGFDGLIRPCSHSHLTYGHVKEGLNKSWSNLKCWRTGELLPTQCQQCSHLYQCSGGCRMEAYATTGSISGSDPYANGPECVPLKTVLPLLEARDDASYCFNPDLKHRPEEFGSILFISPRNWLPVTSSLYTFMLSGARNFKVDQLASVLSVSEKEAKRTTALLLSKKILVERRE